jgi:hypothetical protein
MALEHRTARGRPLAPKPNRRWNCNCHHPAMTSLERLQLIATAAGRCQTARLGAGGFLPFAHRLRGCYKDWWSVPTPGMASPGLQSPAVARGRSKSRPAWWGLLVCQAQPRFAGARRRALLLGAMAADAFLLRLAPAAALVAPATLLLFRSHPRSSDQLACRCSSGLSLGACAARWPDSVRLRLSSSAAGTAFVTGRGGLLPAASAAGVLLGRSGSPACAFWLPGGRCLLIRVCLRFGCSD